MDIEIWKWLYLSKDQSSKKMNTKLTEIYTKQRRLSVVILSNIPFQGEHDFSERNMHNFLSFNSMETTVFVQQLTSHIILLNILQ